MHVELFVEDPSTETAVGIILRRLLVGAPASSATWRVQSLHDKPQMLRKLLAIFRALARGHYADRIVVVIDGDSDDCRELKRQILENAITANLIASNERTAESRLRIRIAMTELESWFIGDPAAVRSAYPRVTAGDMKITAKDSVDTLPNAWEWLEHRLIRRGYYITRMPKVEVARMISEHLDLSAEANASHSFRLFLRTLRETYELD